VIGVDTGGTFTDVVRLVEGRLETGKLPSSPADPSEAVAAGIASLPGTSEGAEVVHGSTVALNALLTGNGARAALVTNAGFRDLIEIGRQERPELYDLHPIKDPPVVPRELRFEIAQRSWPDASGKLIEDVRPKKEQLAKLAREIKKSGADSIAICLLHSYADPSIEQRVARALKSLGLPITCSAEILPAYREVERFSTATVNAALVPVMSAYLERLTQRLEQPRVSVMQSSGGTLSADRAALEPVRVLLSGPAGGVVGAARAAGESGFRDIATLDMGGTSTDVAFHSTRAGLSGTVSDSRVGGHAVSVPSLDIHTIGCGGGSLVRVDAGGVMHVGPASAGADPGPVCYGNGDELTVTDAHALLGHISVGGFLGGELALDMDGVESAFEKLARKLGVKPHAAAQGVLDVARASMRRAVGVMTMQRGRDPQSLPLVAFGGAGGLSAAALAESLTMQGALIPAQPGVLSAYGMATADALSDHGRTILAPLRDWKPSARKRALAELAALGKAELREAGHAAQRIEFESSLDLRYEGQSYEIRVPEGADPARAFAAQHKALYGWSLDTHAIELVQLSLRAVVRTALPRRGRKVAVKPLPKSAIRSERRAWFGRAIMTPCVQRESLRPGHRVKGPAILEEFSGTTLVPPGTRADVLAGGHLWLTRA